MRLKMERWEGFMWNDTNGCSSFADIERQVSLG